MVLQFLSRLPRIRSRQYLFVLSSKSYLPLKLSTACLSTRKIGAFALSYPPRVRVRATVKLSAAFFNDESLITIGGGGVRKCNSAEKSSPKKNYVNLTD